MQLLNRHFEIFADYHQFYLWDAGVIQLAPEDYTDDDVRRRVKVAPNVVVVQPERNMTVPVDFELHDGDPQYGASRWDHIVECSLELPTRKFQIHECTGGPVFDLVVAAGLYRVRVLFSGLGTLSVDGLDGDDHYSIFMWPGSAIPLTVVKQWPGDRRG